MRRRTESMDDRDLLRIGILVAGALLMLAIWYFGSRPRKEQQGRRRESPAPAAAARREPQLDDDGEGEGAEAAGGEVSQPELGLEEPAAASTSTLGKREIQDFDKIVSLYVAARAGSVLRGEDIVVAA